jgi:hypothetical protein
MERSGNSGRERQASSKVDGATKPDGVIHGCLFTPVWTSQCQLLHKFSSYARVKCLVDVDKRSTLIHTGRFIDG